MKKIEEMISRLCPEGVKYEKLILCADILYGYPFDAKLFTEDESFIPLIRIRDVVPGLSNTFYKGEYEEKYIILKGDILVGMDGNFNLGKWKGSNGILCQRTLKITSNDEKKCLNNYLFHLLGPLFKQIEEETPGGSVKHLSAKVINKIEIPLPHPDIQKEIVRILDNFTSLQENLEEELKLRQKQYEYYREKLLTFEEGECEWKKLGDIGNFSRGNGLQKSDFRDNGFPCIHYGQVHTYYGFETNVTISFCTLELSKKLRKAKYGDLLIATTSEDVEACCKSVVWMGNGAVAYSGDSYCFSHNQNPKFIGYLFHSENFAKQKRKVATGAKVIRVSGDSMSSFIVPIPSLARQQEIVNILDKFEAMIANIKGEIELRKKQYEFYREKLLTF